MSGDWHSHRAHQLLYARSGRVLLLTEQASWVLPPQRAAWIRGGTRHRVEVPTRCSLRTVYLRGELDLPARPPDGLPDTPTRWATLPGAARAAGLSTRTLSRRLRAETGGSFRDYLHAARMLEATALLEDGLSVTEVSIALGYHSLGSFSRLFTAWAGQAPSTWARA